MRRTQPTTAFCAAADCGRPLVAEKNEEVDSPPLEPPERNGAQPTT